jgi:deoxyribonuclease-4
MGQTQDTPQLPYDLSDEYRPEPPKPPEPPFWQDGSIRIGIHTSIAGDIAEALETAHQLGANAVQIFSASPRMWPPRGFGPSAQASNLRSIVRSPGTAGLRGGARISAADAERFRSRRAALGLGPLVVHDNYLINLASPDRVLRARSIQALHSEVVRALALGTDFLVVHPGARRGNSLAQALEDLAAALRLAMRGLNLGTLRILLENSAGQGTSLGASFAELKQILDACAELPLGVCLDTAHLFAAGYDIRTAERLEQTLEAIERGVGFERVFLVHVNDSKAQVGSRLDRHEHIGRGRIGLEAFRRLLNHPLLAGRAFILETPIDKPGDDRRNLRTLWRLVGVKARQARHGGNAPGARDRLRPKRKRTNTAVTAPQRTRRRERRGRSGPGGLRSAKRKARR